MTIDVLTTEQDMLAFSQFLDDMKHRIDGPSARQQISPILLEALQPMVASEKSFLADHTRSGALSRSLKARTGSGDRPGKISAFSAPTATNALESQKSKKGE